MKHLSLVCLTAAAGIALSLSAAAQTSAPPDAGKTPAATAEKPAPTPAFVNTVMPPMEDLSAKGKIEKLDVAKTGVDGKEVKFMLIQADGNKIALPQNRDVDLEKYAGKEVTVAGKGHMYKRASKSGDVIKKPHFVKVLSVTEGSATPAAAKDE